MNLVSVVVVGVGVGVAVLAAIFGGAESEQFMDFGEERVQEATFTRNRGDYRGAVDTEAFRRLGEVARGGDIFNGSGMRELSAEERAGFA